LRLDPTKRPEDITGQAKADHDAWVWVQWTNTNRMVFPVELPAGITIQNRLCAMKQDSGHPAKAIASDIHRQERRQAQSQYSFHFYHPKFLFHVSYPQYLNTSLMDRATLHYV
jgi:hypothetical protein